MVDVEDQLTSELRQHESAVYTFFRRMGRQPADAADLTQDTFMRALVGADRFRFESSYRTWLLGIARNLHREWVRRSYKAPIPDDDIDIAAMGDPDAASAVADALDRLPFDERELLVLHHIAGMPSRDIALLLGISDAAARQRISRAAAAFRQIWGER